MAKRTITIKLDENTKEFYHNAFLARKLQTWVGMYRAMHNELWDDDIEDLPDEEILKTLGDKEVAKSHLTAVEFEDYLKYYDEVYTRG